MKTKKTRWDKRGTYTFQFDDGTSITLRPGEDGVTEADIDNALYICLFAFTHRRTGNSVGYEPKRDNNTADFLMGFPTSWTCATADLPCNNDFITFATKPYIRYFLKEL